MSKYVVLIFLIACGTSQDRGNDVPQAVPVAVRAADKTVPLALTVITAADNVTRLPGAEVFVLHASGRLERIGATDQFGGIEVQRAAFLEPQAPAIGVLVCHPVFYCGMLRTEEVAARTESTIALATRVIR
jgi:hypothetical protein